MKQARIIDNEDGIPYRIGAKLLTYTDISGWQDYRFGEAFQEGGPVFPGTLVEAHNGNREYFCDWPRKKFEEELEKFAQKMDEAAKEEIAKYVAAEQAIQREQDLILEAPKKKGEA